MSVNEPITILNSDRPFHHFVAGRYTAKRGWQHQTTTLNDNYELIIGVKGVAYLSVNGIDHELTRGKFMLIPSEATVTGYQKSTVDVEYYWFHFYPKDRVAILTQASLLAALDDRDRLSRIINYAILPAEYMIDNFDNILASANEALAISQEINYTDAIMSYSVTKLALQISNDFINSLHRLVKENPKARLIKDWIRANLDYTLGVKDVALHFDLNYRYLSQLLKAETGFTVENYIIFLKINIAKRLLLESNLPLKVIADRAYFHDEKYFLRLFKKKVGVTPTNYRKNYMEGFLVTGHQPANQEKSGEVNS